MANDRNFPLVSTQNPASAGATLLGAIAGGDRAAGLGLSNSGIPVLNSAKNSQILTTAAPTMPRGASVILFDTTANAIAMSLPDGEVDNEELFLALQARPGANDVTISPTSANIRGAATSIVFNAVGDSVRLRWVTENYTTLAGKWYIVASNSATIS